MEHGRLEISNGGAKRHPVGASSGQFFILKDAQLIFPIKEIVHPTDFSALSKKAFVHALRLALNAQCKLSVIHVAESKTVDEEIAYSFLSRILSQWRLAEQRNSRSISTTALRPQIEHIALRGGDLADTLTEYVSRQEPELIVLGTHGRTGLDHLLKGSIAETLFSRTSASTLFISPHTRGFVDSITGEARLRRVLLPVDHSPSPD
jgi:universal stress protein A